MIHLIVNSKNSTGKQGWRTKVRIIVSNLLIHSSCSYRRVPHGLRVMPNGISGFLVKCPVESLDLTVPLRVKRGCTRIFRVTQPLQLPVEAVFKLSTLIMMNPHGKSNRKIKSL